jgi:hypothetical protein
VDFPFEENRDHFTRSQGDEKVRGWLIVVATLTASVTYSADKGYIAGRPVLLDKFRAQYLIFYYLNVMSFAMSLGIIVLSSNPSFYNRIQWSSFTTFVAIDILAWAGAFVAGSSTGQNSVAYEVGSILAVLSYIATHLLAVAFAPLDI